MKLDPQDPRDAAPERAAETRPPAPAEPSAADREVPLPASELSTAVHAYLDGDQVSDSALSGAERELELWKRISAEAGKRRKMVTPAHVTRQILAKLADD
ncbi:MAG: hypothetical protein WD771_10405 [Gemmatimonadaceae bacterium]